MICAYVISPVNPDFSLLKLLLSKTKISDRGIVYLAGKFFANNSILQYNIDIRMTFCVSRQSFYRELLCNQLYETVKVTLKCMVFYCAGHHNLKELDLERTAVGDIGVNVLSGMSKILNVNCV